MNSGHLFRHVAVAVGVISDAVELQVNVPQAGLERPAAKVTALGKFDPIAGRLHAVETQFAGVADGIDE